MDLRANTVQRADVTQSSSPQKAISVGSLSGVDRPCGESGLQSEHLGMTHCVGILEKSANTADKLRVCQFLVKLSASCLVVSCAEFFRRSMCSARSRPPMTWFPHSMHAVVSSYTGVCKSFVLLSARVCKPVQSGGPPLAVRQFEAGIRLQVSHHVVQSCPL
jgi:hypothetical protein